MDKRERRGHCDINGSTRTPATRACEETSEVFDGLGEKHEEMIARARAQK